MIRLIYRANSVKVIAGSVNLFPVDASVQNRTVEQIINHAQYNPSTLNNDISLLKLENSLDLNYYVWPVPLADQYEAETNLEGKLAVASGWGKTVDGPQNKPEKLRFVDLYIENQDTCKYSYSVGTVFEGVICANTAGGTRGTCHGDSGGPLVLQNGGRLIGITSFVPIRGCQTGPPIGFTRVTYYLDWIEYFTGITS